MTFQDLSYIGALLLAVIAVYNGFVGGRKTSAETYESYERTAKMNQERMEKIQADLDELRQELVDWKDWADRLVAQVKSLGGKPVPFISTRKTGD